MKETVEQRINRIATEFTSCVDIENQNSFSKEILTTELEALVLMAKIELLTNKK